MYFAGGLPSNQGRAYSLVDDILTTGGSIRETVVALEALNVQIVGIGVLVDRSNGAVTFGSYPVHPLISMRVDAWESADCPLCAQGIPVQKPGTTKVG